MTTPTTPAPVGIAAILAAQAAKAKAAAVPTTKSALGKDDFLLMLVTQLKNQDPMNPMDGTEFATQLAQFSNVEQLINISDKLDAQTATAAQNQLTAQTALGSSLIGRDVLVEGNDLVVADGAKTGAVDLSLAAAADKLQIKILDAKGTVVSTQDFTAIGTGQQQLTIDTSDLDAGAYTYQVTATAADGTAVTVAPYETARVDGVSFKDGAIQLRVGNRTIPLLNVIEIKSIATTPVASTAPAASANLLQESLFQ